MAIDVFSPFIGATVNLAVTSASGSVAFSNPFSSQHAAGRGALRVRLFNAGAATVFVRFGGSSVTATTTTDMPIPAGGTEIFDMGDATYVAAITASGTATLYATTGYGA